MTAASNSSDDRLDVARRFLDALNRGDEEAVRSIYDPRVRIWHNFEEGYQSIDDNLRTMRWMHGKLRKLNYDLQRLEALPDGYLQQHVLRGETEQGEAVALQACAICTVSGGRITALEEYLDPAQVAALSR